MLSFIMSPHFASLFAKFLLQGSWQSQAILAQQFAYIIGVLPNLMDAQWWHNDANGIHIWKFLLGLEKLVW